MSVVFHFDCATHLSVFVSGGNRIPENILNCLTARDKEMVAERMQERYPKFFELALHLNGGQIQLALELKIALDRSCMIMREEQGIQTAPARKFVSRDDRRSVSQSFTFKNRSKKQLNRLCVVF